MGNARARGDYEERKAHPQGRVFSTSQSPSVILGMIERGYQKVVTADGEVIQVPVVRRAAEGGQISRDGRSAYYFDGKSLRRVTHAMPTGETDHGA